MPEVKTKNQLSKGQAATERYLQTLQSDKMRQAIMQVLPASLNQQRFMAMAVEAAKLVAQNPNVVKESILISVFQAAKLGLYLDNLLGHAYIVPFKTPSGNALATLIPGYKGLIRLAKESGELKDIKAYLIYDNDKWEMWNDEAGPHFKHVPASGDRGKIEKWGGYCLYWFQGESRPRFHYVDIKKIRNVMNNALRRGGAVWKTDFASMALKTIIRQTVKTLELTPKVGEAVSRDERLDVGLIDTNIPQELQGMISAEYQEVVDEVNEKAKNEIDAAGSSKPATEPVKRKSEKKTSATTPKSTTPRKKSFQGEMVDIIQHLGISIEKADEIINAEFSINTLSEVPKEEERAVLNHFKGLLDV